MAIFIIIIKITIFILVITLILVLRGTQALGHHVGEDRTGSGTGRSHSLELHSKHINHY